LIAPEGRGSVTIADSPEIRKHALYEAKPRTVDTYFKTSLANSSSSANELLQGVNPLSGIVHGRSVLAQTVQKGETIATRKA